MAYYGNPDTLRRLLANLPKFTEAEFMEEVERWNPLVETEIEAELRTVFDQWPAPASTDVNAISLMWLHLMQAYIVETKFSASVTGMGPSSELAKTRYTEVRDRVLAGRIQIPGARRVGSMPKASASTSRRLTMGQGPDQPTDTSTLHQRGLRR